MAKRNPEFPEILNGTTAKALLQLSVDGQFSPETLGVGYAAASGAHDDLLRLGWKVGQVSTKPVIFGWDARREWQHEIATCRDRLTSRAFKEWKGEALAAIAGTPTPTRPSTSTSSEFSVADYTGYPGARLQHPMASSLTYRLFFALVHLNTATPANTGMDPLAMVAAAMELRDSGWPVYFDTDPFLVGWTDDVSAETLYAWRTAFGPRGRGEALAGTLGHRPTR